MKQGRCNTPLTHQPGDTEETVHLRWRQRRKRSIAHAFSAPQRGQGHALFLSECHMSRVTPNRLIVKQLGVTRYIITYVKSILMPVPRGFMRGDGEARPLLEEIERMGDQQPHFRACIEHPGKDLSQIRTFMRVRLKRGLLLEFRLGLRRARPLTAISRAGRRGPLPRSSSSRRAAASRSVFPAAASQMVHSRPPWALGSLLTEMKARARCSGSPCYQSQRAGKSSCGVFIRWKGLGRFRHGIC